MDIRDGTIHRRLPLDPTHRAQLEASLVPDPEKAVKFETLLRGLGFHDRASSDKSESAVSSEAVGEVQIRKSHHPAGPLGLAASTRETDPKVEAVRAQPARPRSAHAALRVEPLHKDHERAVLTGQPLRKGEGPTNRRTLEQIAVTTGAALYALALTKPGPIGESRPQPELRASNTNPLPLTPTLNLNPNPNPKPKPRP